MQEVAFVLINSSSRDYIKKAAQLEAACLEEAWSETAIFNALRDEKGLYALALAGEAVIGVASMYLVLGEGQIMNVAVLPAFRKRGVGGRLFAFLLEEGKKRGADSFFLEVDKNNASAISLYQKNGFSTIGERKGIYNAANKRINLLLHRPY